MRSKSYGTNSIMVALAAIRVKLGWSQLDLAKKMHASQHFVSKLEVRCDEELLLGHVISYAQALGARDIVLCAIADLADTLAKTVAVAGEMASLGEMEPPSVPLRKRFPYRRSKY